MPKQELTNQKECDVIKASKLSLGQLGKIVGYSDGVNGAIITKAFDYYLCVYAPPGNTYTAFKSTWNGPPTFSLEILSPEEKVILSN
jgi:hypothetical protein